MSGAYDKTLHDNMLSHAAVDGGGAVASEAEYVLNLKKENRNLLNV